MSFRPFPLCAALCLLLTACHGDLGPDEGDFEEKEALASCKVKGGEGEPSAACGTLEDFDLSDCDLDFSDTARSGIWNVQLRLERADGTLTYDPTHFSVGYADRPGAINGAELDSSSIVEHTDDVFRITRGHTIEGRPFGSTLVGCKARGSDRLEGCYVSCNNEGVRTRVGTFYAQRITGVPEDRAQRGLRLISETGIAAMTEGAFRDLHVTPVDVYVTKGHAYVVSVYSGLHVFDVRDPAHPVLTARAEYFRRNDAGGWIAAGGEHDLYGRYWNGVWAKGDALYVATSDRGVRVFDISDAAHPRFVRDLSAPPTACTSGCTTGIHTVFVDGDRLYAMKTDPTPEVLIYDVTRPLEPVQVNTFSTFEGVTQASYIHDAFAFEGRLYANYWDVGLVLADVRDVSEPRIKEWSRYTYPNAKSHAVAVGRIKDRVIAFEGGEQWGAHLRVLDVTDTKNIQRIGEYKLDPHVSIHNLQLQGERLYVAYYQHGVRVLDVSNPEDPEEVGSFGTWRESDVTNGYSFYEGAIGIRVNGDGYIYAIDRARGLLILKEE
ncbi:MAG TPA: hypothetical protein VFO83_12475 [Aggregicoccus sp.]|nr:hypothetical protein [Aggregicoccus sp.]